MSVKLVHFIGPFVECRTRRGPVLLQKKTCTNKSCSVKQQLDTAVFCSKCGSSVGFLSYTEDRDLVDPWALSGEDIICFVRSGLQHYWIPNVNRNPPRSLLLCDDPAEGATVLEENQIKQEVSWLDQAFEAEILQLKALSYESVQVRWGILWTWM